MSDGSNPSQKILSEPMKNIGAQDILQVGSTYEGVLRRKGRFKKLMGLGSNKWKQRFVVISQGCIYCFNDEYSSRPISAFSLTVYQSVNETASPHMLHCFEIKHKDEMNPSQVFAAETDAKRKIWVTYIKDAIVQAHQHSGESQSGSDEGISMTTRYRRKTASLPPLPPVPSEMDDAKYLQSSKSEYSLESDDDGPYDDINVQETKSASPKLVQKPAVPVKPTDFKSRPNLPGAVSIFPGMVSGMRQSLAGRPKIDLPTTPVQKQESKKDEANSPNSESDLYDYENNEFFQKETYMFESKDKEKAHSLLQSKPVGTFLVRQGNSTPTVLSVKTDFGVKEFQITEDGSKVSIDRKSFFPSTSALLCYYNQNDLPKKEYQVKLLKGYKT